MFITFSPFSNGDWWLVEHENGTRGYIPRNYVARQHDDESEE
uniref:SH3 domain-containing protein n=1 Tax=Parascaris equorum TaxID=6256 RepID=A0A914R9Y3_PAREQ